MEGKEIGIARENAVINMSWFNPSPDEAIEAYYYNKNRYSSAATQRSASIRQEESYLAEKRSANSEINNLSNQKINLEKRLQGIEDIIKMMEGTGGWFSLSVPDRISKATASICKADSSYRESICVTGGIAAASLETAFIIKTVEDNAYSCVALQEYKNEKVHVEQSIIELENQINIMTERVSSLNRQINACNVRQSELQQIMYASAYEMNHYKKYMY